MFLQGGLKTEQCQLFLCKCGIISNKKKKYLPVNVVQEKTPEEVTPNSAFRNNGAPLSKLLTVYGVRLDTLTYRARHYQHYKSFILARICKNIKFQEVIY